MQLSQEQKVSPTYQSHHHAELDLSNYNPFFDKKSNTAGFNSFLDNDKFSSPDLATLAKVVDDLIAYDKTTNSINQILETYGSPMWNYSLVNVNSDGIPLVTIPFSNDETITAILIHTEINSTPWFRLYSKDKAQEKILEPETDEMINDWLFPISSFLLYEMEVYDALITDLNDWVLGLEFDDSDFLNTSGDDPTMVSTRCVTTTITFWWTGYEIDASGNYHATTGEFSITIEDCDDNLDLDGGDGGWPNDPFFTGGGEGEGETSSSNENLFDMEDLDLDSDVVDCLNDNITSEAKLILQDLLESGLLKDNCGERSPEEIVTDLINSLCEDFSNNNASGNSTGDEEEDLGNEQVNINQWNIQAALENDDCIKIGYISCESFTFHDIGNSKLSKISNESFRWIDVSIIPSIPSLVKNCFYDFEFATPEVIWLIEAGGNEGYSITDGIAANAAAEAFNNTAAATTDYFRTIYFSDITQIPCDDVENHMITGFLDEYKQELKNLVASYYNLPPTGNFIFDEEPNAGIGFDPAYSHLSSTETIMDLSLIIGVNPDNCID